MEKVDMGLNLLDGQLENRIPSPHKHSLRGGGGGILFSRRLPCPSVRPSVCDTLVFP